MMELPNNFFAQLLGLFSFVLGAACFLQKNDRRFKFLHMALNINHSVHFYLMEAYTSAMSTVVSILRTGCSIRTSSKYAAYFFILLNIGLGILTVTHWYSWLSVIGGCFGTYGLFCLSGISMRVMMTIGCLFWLSNNLIVGSIGGIMLESMVLLVNLSTMLRLHRSQPKMSTP